jgi:hypothetical protein
MINVSTVMKQVQDWLADGAGFDEFKITRSEYVNEDPGIAMNGWIGIYRRTVDYEPRNLGKPTGNYEASVGFVVMVQRASLKDGESCEDALEESVKAVLDRMIQIPKTYIDHFSDITIDYTYLESERKTMYFQGALITFTAEISTEVN